MLQNALQVTSICVTVEIVTKSMDIVFKAKW